MATTTTAPTSTRLHALTVGLMTVLRILAFGGVLGFLLGGHWLLVYYGGHDLQINTGRALLGVLGFVIGGAFGFFLERAEERARRQGGGLPILLLTRASEGVPVGFLVAAFLSNQSSASNANAYALIGSIAGAVLGILIEVIGRNVRAGGGLLVMRLLRTIYKAGLGGVSGATVGLAFGIVSVLQNPPAVTFTPGSSTGNPVGDVVQGVAGLSAAAILTLFVIAVVLLLFLAIGAMFGVVVGLVNGLLLEFSWKPAQR